MHQMKKRSDNSKHSFGEKLEQVFDQFLKYYTNFLKLNINAKMGGESI
jgi:hypothetical protein